MSAWQVTSTGVKREQCLARGRVVTERQFSSTTRGQDSPGLGNLGSLSILKNSPHKAHSVDRWMGFDEDDASHAEEDVGGQLLDRILLLELGHLLLKGSPEVNILVTSIIVTVLGLFGGSRCHLPLLTAPFTALVPTALVVLIVLVILLLFLPGILIRPVLLLLLGDDLNVLHTQRDVKIHVASSDKGDFSHLVEEVLGLNYGKLLLAPDTGDHDPLHPRPDPLFLRKKEAHFSTVLMK